MNTKIIVALVIGIALVGLTGAASAASYTGYSDYIHIDSLVTEVPTALDVNSGTCFTTVIDHFDNNYGFPNPSDPVYVGGGVYNTMYASPEMWYSEGIEHQTATQSGTAGITFITKDSEDDLPELTAEITSAQSLYYSGSFSGYDIMTADKGMIGAYGLQSDGIDFGAPGVQDDCGNIFLKSESYSEGSTLAWGGAKLTEGSFSVATVEGLIAELEGVPLGEANFDIYGGVSVASTFAGTTGDWGSISTDIYGSEEASVHTGWAADNLDGFCIDP